MRPDGSKRNQEGPIHQTLQVRGKPHSDIGKMLFSKTGQQPKQEQNTCHETSTVC
jgi:hypothetical protein